VRSILATVGQCELCGMTLRIEWFELVVVGEFGAPYKTSIYPFKVAIAIIVRYLWYANM